MIEIFSFEALPQIGRKLFYDMVISHTLENINTGIRDTPIIINCNSASPTACAAELWESQPKVLQILMKQCCQDKGRPGDHISEWQVLLAEVLESTEQEKSLWTPELYKSLSPAPQYGSQAFLLNGNIKSQLQGVPYSVACMLCSVSLLSKIKICLIIKGKYLIPSHDQGSIHRAYLRGTLI